MYAVPRHRAFHSSGEFSNMLSQGSNHSFCFFARDLDQHGKARMTFDQSRDVAVLATAQQIAFPMTRNRSVFHFRRPFADRDGIDDLTPSLPADRCMSRPAHAPLGSHVVHLPFFHYSPR